MGAYLGREESNELLPQAWLSGCKQQKPSMAHMGRGWGESKMDKTATPPCQGRTGSRAVRPVHPDACRILGQHMIGPAWVMCMPGAGHLDWHSWYDPGFYPQLHPPLLNKQGSAGLIPAVHSAVRRPSSAFKSGPSVHPL